MATRHNHGSIFRRMEPGELIKQARESRGWSQADLGRRIGISQPAIKKIEAGDTRQSKFLYRIATELGLDLDDLDPGVPDPTIPIPRSKLVGFDNNFPVHASAEGGKGQIIITSDAIDFMPRPAPLVHVKEAYGLIITGTSMEPEFRQGDIALVNPHLPQVAFESYIFYAEKEGQARATIKELRRATETLWHVHQHNPPEGMKHDFTLPKEEWRWAHRVVGSYKRRG